MCYSVVAFAMYSFQVPCQIFSSEQGQFSSVDKLCDTLLYLIFDVHLRKNTVIEYIVDIPHRTLFNLMLKIYRSLPVFGARHALIEMSVNTYGIFFQFSYHFCIFPSIFQVRFSPPHFKCIRFAQTFDNICLAALSCGHQEQTKIRLKSYFFRCGGFDNHALLKIEYVGTEQITQPSEFRVTNVNYEANHSEISF